MSISKTNSFVKNVLLCRTVSNVAVLLIANYALIIKLWTHRELVVLKTVQLMKSMWMVYVRNAMIISQTAILALQPLLATLAITICCRTLQQTRINVYHHVQIRRSTIIMDNVQNARLKIVSNAKQQTHVINALQIM